MQNEINFLQNLESELNDRIMPNIGPNTNAVMHNRSVRTDVISKLAQRIKALKQQQNVRTVIVNGIDYRSRMPELIIPLHSKTSPYFEQVMSLSQLYHHDYNDNWHTFSNREHALAVVPEYRSSKYMNSIRFGSFHSLIKAVSKYTDHLKHQLIFNGKDI